MATQLLPIKSGTNQGSYLSPFAYGDKNQYTGFKVNIGNLTSVLGRNKTVGRLEKVCSYTAWSLKELNQVLRKIFNIVVSFDNTSNGRSYYLTADFKKTPVGFEFLDNATLYYFDALKDDDSVQIEGEGYVLARKYSLITLRGCNNDEKLYNEKIEAMHVPDKKTKRPLWINTKTGEIGDSPDKPAGAEFFSFTYVPIEEDKFDDWKPWGSLQELRDTWKRDHPSEYSNVIVVKKEETKKNLINVGDDDDNPFSDENTNDVVNPPFETHSSDEL